MGDSVAAAGDGGGKERVEAGGIVNIGTRPHEDNRCRVGGVCNIFSIRLKGSGAALAAVGGMATDERPLTFLAGDALPFVFVLLVGLYNAYAASGRPPPLAVRQRTCRSDRRQQQRRLWSHEPQRRRPKRNEHRQHLWARQRREGKVAPNERVQ